MGQALLFNFYFDLIGLWTVTLRWNIFRSLYICLLPVVN